MAPFTVGVRWVRRSTTERWYYESPEQALLHICESSDKATGSIHMDVFNKTDPFLKIEKVHAVLCNGIVARSTRKKETAQKLADQFNAVAHELSEQQAGDQLSVNSLFSKGSAGPYSL